MILRGQYSIDVGKIRHGAGTHRNTLDFTFSSYTDGNNNSSQSLCNIYLLCLKACKLVQNSTSYSYAPLQSTSEAQVALRLRQRIGTVAVEALSGRLALSELRLHA